MAKYPLIKTTLKDRLLGGITRKVSRSPVSRSLPVNSKCPA